MFRILTESLLLLVRCDLNHFLDEGLVSLFVKGHVKSFAEEVHFTTEVLPPDPPWMTWLLISGKCCHYLVLCLTSNPALPGNPTSLFASCVVQTRNSRQSLRRWRHLCFLPGLATSTQPKDWNHFKQSSFGSSKRSKAPSGVLLVRCVQRRRRWGQQRSQLKCHVWVSEIITIVNRSLCSIQKSSPKSCLMQNGTSIVEGKVNFCLWFKLQEEYQKIRLLDSLLFGNYIKYSGESHFSTFSHFSICFCNTCPAQYPVQCPLKKINFKEKNYEDAKNLIYLNTF